MEVEKMLEDDVFFAELSKRISLLITDDDECADFAAAAQLIPAAAAQPLPVSLESSIRSLSCSSSLLQPSMCVHVCSSVGGWDQAGPGEEAIASVAAGLGASRSVVSWLVWL